MKFNIFRKKHNIPLRILLATNGLILFSGAMLAPIYAIFIENVGGDLLDASFAAGIFAVAAAATTILSGKYSDRIKESELVVVAGYVALGVGFFLLTRVSSVWGLFAVQLLTGVAEATYSPAFDKVYSKHLDFKREGREWGFGEAMNYSTSAAGAFIGGLIAVRFGFSALFVTMAVLALFSGLYILLLPRKVL